MIFTVRLTYNESKFILRMNKFYNLQVIRATVLFRQVSVLLIRHQLTK